MWLSDVDRIEFFGLTFSPRDDVPALRMRETHNVQGREWLYLLGHAGLGTIGHRIDLRFART